jgi:FAD/FMN-containing dehydrogenase/SAM-dependent methyltransferase
MGGQTASPGSLHLDMRKMNQILHFDPQKRTIRVQAGTRWCDIQRFVDPHGLAVKIMQTYANFTVGGSLSVNAHGRYIGLGPVILSVRQIVLVLADGSTSSAGPDENAELFYAAVGGYGAIGVITEAELDLVENVRIERRSRKMDTADYTSWFDVNVRHRKEAVFHNADLYPPHFTRIRAVSWFKTEAPATTRHRLQPLRRTYPLEKYFLWAISETPMGKWRREYLIDPLLFWGKKVYWRNYEAGYDTAELEPLGRTRRTYVLQEYFVPYDRLMEFVPKMAAVLNKHRVNAINVSIRHALGDPGSLLAWARGETFAFVLYYKQRTRDNARERVGVWTRELIDAVIDCGGTYYLPYQLHATPEQFHRAYPRAQELFSLKRRLDPQYRLRGALWDKYYAPLLKADGEGVPRREENSLFHAVYGKQRAADQFYAFLQNIFHLFPEDRLHTLIKQACKAHGDDESIYRAVQAGLDDITPPLSLLRYALPSLRAQKEEMGRQTASLLGRDARLIDYVEIGSTGRYVKALRKHLNLQGTVTLVNDKAPGNTPVDIVERGQLRPIGSFVPLNDYAPLDLPAASADLVSCFVGLHHMEPHKLAPFLASIARVLRPGGYFVLRDHDVTSKEMDDFVSLAHCVFNAGLGEAWGVNAAELRYFDSIATWINRVEAAGMCHTGDMLRQEGDPSDNLLLAFRKEGGE